MFALSEARCRDDGRGPAHERKQERDSGEHDHREERPAACIDPHEAAPGIDLVGEGRVVEQDCGHDRPQDQRHLDDRERQHRFARMLPHQPDGRPQHVTHARAVRSRAGFAVGLGHASPRRSKVAPALRR